MLRRINISLLCWLLAATVHAAELDQIGDFDFPSSGNPQAHQHFLRGVGYLHSFGFTQARREFRRAQELDADFALAYWGETFTYNHPFIAEWDAITPAQVMTRLGPSHEERLAKAPTEREKGFVRAAEAYAFTDGTVANKRTAWMQAMDQLYRQFPNDREVKAFYAVSLLSGATAAGEMGERLRMKAGALALELFKENENHPGAAHYIIHAFDDPVHAPLALDAAYHYADIAPAVAHARHMPTHIFIQHGMWNEVALWNESSFNAAAALWQPGDRPNDLNHSSDWGQYGDLQLWNLDKSLRWIELAEQVLRNNPDDARSANTVRTMQARHVIETRHWQLQALTEDLTSDQLLALGLSAANLGDPALTNEVAARLQQLVQENPSNAPIRISQLEVASLAAYQQGNQQQTLELLKQAVELTDQQEFPRGAANPLQPAHELYGEMLLLTGQPEQAAGVFATSLLRTPNRPWSLLGAARSQAQLNNRETATTYYETLLAVWSDDSHPPVQEAKRYLGF